MQQVSVNRYSLFILRVTLSGIFIIAAINHLFFTDHVLAKLSNAPGFEVANSIASPERLIVITGVFMAIGGIAILFGFLTRWAAIGLLLILLSITLTVQVGQWSTSGPLFKNVAIIGGLIFFAINDAKVMHLSSLKFKNSK